MTAPTRFDRDTAVELVEPGLYRGSIDRGWWIINGPNGGYVAAIVLRAMVAAVADAARSPRSLTIHYLRPPAEGPVDVAVVVERAGRTLTTVSARLLQGGKLLCLAIGAFASPREGFSYADRKMPSLKSPAECRRFLEEYPGSVELQKRYDSRQALGGALGSGSERGLIGGWIRLAEHQEVDALAVAAFTDAYVPAILTRTTARGGLGPIPTIDLTIHFRATLPVSGALPEDFCAVVFTSDTAREGFVEENGEVWSSDGVLLAESRQLALLV